MLFVDCGFIEIFWPRHTLMVSLALQRYVSELTLGVCSTCRLMISCTIISLSCVSISSLASMGTVHLLCCTGGMLVSSGMEYSPCILPILFKESGNMFFRSLILWTVLLSCKGETVVLWS